MGNKIGLSAFAVILVFLLSGMISNLSAQSGTWAENPLLAWERDNLQAFDRNHYDKVIETAQNQANDPNGNAFLFIYYGHAQKYYLERDRNSALYYKRQYQTTLTTMLFSSSTTAMLRNTIWSATGILPSITNDNIK